MRKITAFSGHLPVSNLDPASFAPFGEVIQNPRAHHGRPNLATVEANQGTATKWLDITHMENYYGRTTKDAKCSMNMFVCRPRQLKGGRLFNVGILERHPYTPQTFVPMGLGKSDRETAYLVVVAPTLPVEMWRDAEGETGSSRNQATQDTRQRGPPDLANVKAFIARGDQAVTYGAGTWHAPMVVLGAREVEFVVVQYMNSVAEDDVQEVALQVGDGGDGLDVDIGAGEMGTKSASPRL